jgi:hypothetical protein
MFPLYFLARTLYAPLLSPPYVTHETPISFSGLHHQKKANKFSEQTEPNLLTNQMFDRVNVLKNF